MKHFPWVIVLSSLLQAEDSGSLLEAVRKAGDLYRQGQHQEADEAAANAIAMIESRREEANFDVAWSLNNVGALLYAQGDLDRAERFFARSRDAYLALAGASDPRFATAIYNLAGVLVEKGKYSDAERLYTQVIAIRKQVLGSTNPLLAEVWNDLGFLCLQQRRYKDAEAWLEKAANLWRVSTGTEAYAAVAQNNLAMLRRLEGNFKQSEALYKGALETEETKFGPEHPEVATTLVNLASLYRIRGNDEEAEKADRRALGLLEKSLGENDPMALEIRARLKQAGGDFQLLLVRTNEEAVELQKKLFAGEEFAQLASRYSIDPSATSGGSVRARVSEVRAELRDIVQVLKPGETSAVFRLDRNWAIVRRTK